MGPVLCGTGYASASFFEVCGVQDPKLSDGATVLARAGLALERLPHLLTFNFEVEDTGIASATLRSAKLQKPESGSDSHR
jgi:hypothetical protein